jgi:hypothetical protein
MARFVFPSAQVEPGTDNGILRVRFYARTDDQLILTRTKGTEGRNFGSGALIKIKVEVSRGVPECEALPEDTSDYTPGIEFVFTGACTARKVLVNDQEGFEVESAGLITCLETTGLPWSETELREASVIEIGGERGNKGPHFPK